MRSRPSSSAETARPLQARLFKVRDLAARSSDVYLRHAVSNLPMSRSVDQLITWTKVTIDICANRTAQPSTIILGPGPATTSRPAPATEAPAPPAKAITPQEAEAMTKRAAEKTGAKKCETKVYGGGAAVTVCE